MSTDYQALKQEIEDRLTALGVTWGIQLIGDSCPPFCEDKGKPGIGQFPRKTHIHGQHYRLTLTRGYIEPCGMCCGRGHYPIGATCPQCNGVGNFRILDPKKPHTSLSVDYWNSYADVEATHKIGAYGDSLLKVDTRRKQEKESRRVRVADVIVCAQLTDPGSFESFAGDMGMDTDSRKAENVWRACCDQYRDFRRMFTEIELEEIGEKAREL